MSRQIPSIVLPNLLGQQTGEAFIVLLDIKHANGTIYLCNNSVDLNSNPNAGDFWELDQRLDVWETEAGDLWEIEASEGGIAGDTYLAFPFTITLPQDVEGQASTATISVENVSRYLIDEIRSQEERLSITIHVVQASTMEVIATFPDMEVQDVRYSVMTLSMQLTLENFLQEPFPKDIMSKFLFPGLFA